MSDEEISKLAGQFAAALAPVLAQMITQQHKPMVDEIKRRKQETIFGGFYIGIAVRKQPQIRQQPPTMKTPTEDQRAIARKCASVEEGVKELKRTGLNGGKAIKLIAQQNPKAYNVWRSAPVQQSKSGRFPSTMFAIRGV
jgi:hypothetical protein